MQSIVQGAGAVASARGTVPPATAARLVLPAIGPAVALLLQLAALATYLWGNDLLGYNLGLLALPAAALLFTGGREGRGSVPFSSKLPAAGFAAIALLLLPVGAIHARGLLGSLSALEVTLLAGAASDLLLAGIAVFHRGLSAAGRTLLLCWALLAAVSRVLHYNPAYDVGTVETETGLLNYWDGFRRVSNVRTGANVALALVFLWSSVRVRFEALAALADRVTSALRTNRTWVAGVAVVAAIGAAFCGLVLERSPSRPLFALFGLLAVAAWAAAGMQRRHTRRMWLSIMVAGALGLFVDPGLTLVISLVMLFLAPYSLTTGIQPDRSSPVHDRIRSWTPALTLVFFVFVRTGIQLVAVLAGEPPPVGEPGPVWLSRVWAVIHPGGGGDFSSHMYTAQTAMRGALAHGGIFGDGWWHNRLYFPQMNSDFVLATLSHYHGLAVWGPVGLVVVFLYALARLALTKAFDGDGVKAEALGGVALATFLAVALPAIWILAALALVLPWTGIPFPFFSRGAYLHAVLTCMVAAVVLLEMRTLPAARATGHAPPSPPRVAFRHAVWTTAVLGVFFIIQFHWKVQRPALRPAVERPRYILVPENAGEVVRLVPGAAPEDSEYRVANAIVRLVAHDRTDRHLEDFAYISGYEFNEAEARRGISIGQDGRFSPVVRTLLGAYVRKANDVILFWEEMDGRLFLRPSSTGIKVAELPASGVQVSADLGRKVGVNEELSWGTTLRIGGTRLRLDRVASGSEALRIELDLDVPSRAYGLRLKQGTDFRIYPDRVTIIGGLHLAGSAIEPGRPLKTGWVRHNRQYARGTLRDRSGGELVRPAEQGTWLADLKLLPLIGKARWGKPFGLDYVFDQILSGAYRRGSPWEVTMRTLRGKQLLGDDIFLTIDLPTQKKLTDVFEQFADNTDAARGSAVILDSLNRVVALADFDRRTDEALPSDPGAQGVTVPDSTLEDWLKSRDFRRYDRDLNTNPFLRRPLAGAFANDLTGSVFKGFIYASALADHFAGRRRFTEAPDLRAAHFLAVAGDLANTATRGGSRILTSETALVPFGGVRFRRIHNYGRAAIPPVLGDAIARSSNIAPAYLAIGLGADTLGQHLDRFGLKQELLLRPEALREYARFLNDDPYVLAEPIRFADSFEWSNSPSDLARLGGLGDKAYLSLLHVAVFYATFLLHDGVFVHPTVVSDVGEDAVHPPRFPVFSPTVRTPTVDAMKTLFRLPFETGGTGATFVRGLSPGVGVLGGKTGTASAIVNDAAPHRIFVAVVEVDGEAYTIATRVNRTRARENSALELGRQIVLDVLR